MGSKITVKDIMGLKNRRKITMLTAYDYPLARLIDKAGIDMILVGDSVANVVLGLESTTQVGMKEMLHHTKAVTRAVGQALVVADMPYDSYQINPQDSLKNARSFINEAKADAVKLEWFDKCLEVSENIIKAGIPVMGHIGLTPQTADKLGGFKVQGRDAERAKCLIEQAISLQDLGCFAVVLECVPDRLSALITKRLKIPTIGIGAGSHCDGQVLVTYDMLGLFERFKPKFVKQYINLAGQIQHAIEEYKNEVLENRFPLPEHSFTIKQEEFDKINEA